MIFLLFGPPGAGKGTQSDMLVKELHVKHVSTGDILREAIKQGTKLGIEAQSFMNRGALVPDPVVIGLIEEVFSKGSPGGFLLDGFPRTIAQAQALDETLSRRGEKLEKAVFIDVKDEVLEGRLSGRMTCTSCGAAFNIKTAPSKVVGICDRCQGKLEQRKDDRAEAIKERLSQYSRNTSPLKDYYKNQKIFVSVDGENAPKDVLRAILQALGRK